MVIMMLVVNIYIEWNDYYNGDYYLWKES